jgi:hypothetical protein
MGYAEEPLPDPQQFLKKKSNDSTTVAPTARKSFLIPLLYLILVCLRNEY